MNIHPKDAAPHLEKVERPVGTGQIEKGWGSDYLADVIRAMQLDYVTLNPGASFRGLHDSFVNYLGNEDPQMLLCLHEEHAVAIAHGYAKVAERPMGAFVHSNVGLMHASMAIFNAWCDRVPMVVFGATGAVDAALRRPWIEWIHTAKDQGGLVRDFTKWDDQPVSLAAAGEALARALQISTTAPKGPTYVCFPSELQEARQETFPPVPEMARFAAPRAALPSPDLVAEAARLLAHARRPVILAGRVSRSRDAWDQRVALAEALNAPVLTDLKVGAAFPTDHPLHAATPSLLVPEGALSVLREADVILSLDWLDLGGTLATAFKGRRTPTIIQASVDVHAHRGWSMDYQTLPPVDVNILAEPDIVTPLLLDAVRKAGASGAPRPERTKPKRPEFDRTAKMGVREFGQVVSEAIDGLETCLIRLPLGWAGDSHAFTHPLAYLGYDGGGGIGSGPGMSIGAALALRGTGTLPVAVLGDGDFMMGCSALWTAARYRIPLLIVICNNQSFYNDEVHQERVATIRDRPVENKWIGQRIAGPDIDFAKLAEAQGAVGFGPCHDATSFATALAKAIELVQAGEVVVVEARVNPGYDQRMASALTKD